MKKTVLLLMGLLIIAIVKLQAQPNAWINEFHYDDASTDIDEFVEIVIENPGSYTLSDIQLDLYNGSNGTVYGTKTLDAFLEGSSSGNFTIYTYSFPVNGIQNGAPDGMALSYQGVLITGQFLSYEGSFTGVGGPADGVTSTDIGVLENGEPEGNSLQLSGSGTQYSNFSWQSPATQTLGNLNNSQSFGGIVYAQIVKAWSISSTAVDVQYNLAVTSVDPSDYYMTGTDYIEFSTATIDADPTIVHLSGADPIIAGDAVLDNLFDVANDNTNIEFYGGILPIAHTNESSSNPYDLILTGYTATFQGIVSANDGFNNVWVSDGAGGYNGILVYDSDFDALVSVGEEILFNAVRSPYNNLSEIINASLISIISGGNSPYGPTNIDGSDISSTIAANTDPAEPYEGQLVSISNFVVDSLSVVSPNYACSWSDAKATYTFYVGNNVASVPLTVGATYLSITGVIDWYWSGPYYRINPRSLDDVVPLSVNPATKLAVISVNSGVDPYENNDFDVVVQIQDAFGDPAFVTGDLSFSFTTNGGDLGVVDFTTGSTVSGTILNGTSEVTVTEVSMAPAGTNVTITATDDDPFGLLSGTSLPFNVLDFTLPQIIITEVMQNPDSVSDSSGEWFEVYNNSSSAVNMAGWIMKDLGSNSHTIAGPLTVPAFGFAVLGNNADPGTNGGYACDYAFPSSFALGNSDDEIILYLPDGVTEIDRIEWDGGPVWPDPHGASMVYTGLADEENNDGTLWSTAVLVESTYTNPDWEKGSPGTNGADQVLTEGFSLDIKVLLEGAYDIASHSMTSDLFLPYEQPYGPALPYYGNSLPLWQYEGTETSPSIAGAVTTDWILVELRDESYSDAGTGIQIPALLEVNGQVCSYNGSRRLSIKSDFFTGMYIVIWHRNHLGIMSATGLNPVEGTLVSYDFTTGLDKVYDATTDDYKELETGVWGMAAGDVNADGAIDDLDVVDGWATDAGNAGYLGGDLNMDDQSNNQDKNDYWFPNNGASYHIPF
ncbi:MAG: lamin tail domain-containing protein [Bacteroidales bacterium]|nr:lamin tail domain-containing protein [Bacteroidales bacterium]